mgnify:CR=1 FL=1
MKKTVTSLSFSAKRMTGRLVFAMLSFVFFTATAFGQSNNFKEEIGDLSLIVWKLRMKPVLLPLFSQEDPWKTKTASTPAIS